MPDQEFEYDVFLSHAGEDTEWCETLTERLRNEGVRVWFDKWEIQPGDNVLAKINDGLAKSRKMVAVWSANYFSVRLWEVKSGKLLRALEGQTNTVWSVHFSPDGEKLASGSSDNSVRLWEVETGKCLHVLEGHLGPLQSVCYRPGAHSARAVLVTAGVAGRLQFWDAEKGETFLYRYHLGPGAWLDLLPDGRFDACPEGMR